MPCCYFEDGEVRGFQCSGPMGEFREMSYKEIVGKEPLEPYYDDECPHEERYEYKGELICKKCGAKYNEKFMEWEDSQ